MDITDQIFCRSARLYTTENVWLGNCTELAASHGEGTMTVDMISTAFEEMFVRVFLDREPTRFEFEIRGFLEDPMGKVDWNKDGYWEHKPDEVKLLGIKFWALPTTFTHDYYTRDIEFTYTELEHNGKPLPMFSLEVLKRDYDVG